MACDKILNEQLYGEGTSAEAVVQGGVRPPQYFGELYDELWTGACSGTPNLGRRSAGTALTPAGAYARAPDATLSLLDLYVIGTLIT